ncbi:MAG: 6-carboxytetrahydropterin synthase QueD [Polyangiales bacterium]
MLATLQRRYTFEASHRLPYVPEGHKCGRVHGHSYRVTVLVRGPVNSAGMVCDFADVDAIARPVVADLDHRHLNELLPNPTSELLALWLLRKLAAVPHLYAVTVAETERSAATVTVDDAGPLAGNGAAEKGAA